MERHITCTDSYRVFAACFCELWLLLLLDLWQCTLTKRTCAHKQKEHVSQKSVKVQIHNHAISVFIIVSKGIILFIILCLSTSTRRIDESSLRTAKKVNLLFLLLIYFEFMFNPAISVFYTPTWVILYLSYWFMLFCFFQILLQHFKVNAITKNMFKKVQ